MIKFRYFRGQEKDRSNSGSRLFSSFNVSASSPVEDRLKPPPSVSSGERKIIHLKSKSDSTSSPSVSTVSSTSEISDKGSKSSTISVPTKDKQNTLASKPIKIKRLNFGERTGQSNEKATIDIVSSTSDEKTFKCKLSGHMLTNQKFETNQNV